MNSNYTIWLKKVKDKELKNELKGLTGAKLDNAFYKELSFGTAGLRGEIGVGTNCLNIYTVAKVTQGIANSMTTKGQKVVAISYDSRIKSDLFAKTAASIFAANGIKVYISKELMPVPYLSFLVRSVKANIGVMITASHNPSIYNGYKVYGNDGCQLTDNAANEMTSFIAKVDYFDTKSIKFEKALKQKLICYADDSIEEDYLTKTLTQNLNKADEVKVVYSPLNGAGYRLVPKILYKIGVKSLSIVKEQGYPCGKFTTCSYPNPEKKEALKLSLDLAKEVDADIVIATDPDADRLGVAVKHKDDYQLLNGNEMGVLLADYILSIKKANSTLPKDSLIVKTIVSTELATKVAASYGIDTVNVLTGFKYIGEKILELEKEGQENHFIFGFEESYGSLAGTAVRDKDAVVSSMLAVEMAAYYKKQSKTLIDRMNEIYAKFGFYQTENLSLEFLGASGNAKMQELLDDFRAKLPKKIAGLKVEKTTDYLTQKEFNLPKANVVSLFLEKGTQLIVRPSGTEPLIKMYITAAQNIEINQKIFTKIKEYLNEKFKS